MENEINFDNLFRLIDSSGHDRKIDKLIKEHYESHKYMEEKYFDLLISKLRDHTFDRLSKERIEKVIIWCQKEKLRVLYSLSNKRKTNNRFIIQILFSSVLAIPGFVALYRHSQPQVDNLELRKEFQQLQKKVKSIDSLQKVNPDTIFVREKTK